VTAFLLIAHGTQKLFAFPASQPVLRHAPREFCPALNGGELVALYYFLFLFIAAAGSGPWSPDALLRRSQQSHWAHGTDDRRRWVASH
jgi:uncharacterized membrane protein YphA (DoxX/SURF4 family)